MTAYHLTRGHGLMYGFPECVHELTTSSGTVATLNQYLLQWHRSPPVSQLSTQHLVCLIQYHTYCPETKNLDTLMHSSGLTSAPHPHASVSTSTPWETSRQNTKPVHAYTFHTSNLINILRWQHMWGMKVFLIRCSSQFTMHAQHCSTISLPWLRRRLQCYQQCQSLKPTRCTTKQNMRVDSNVCFRQSWHECNVSHLGDERNIVLRSKLLYQLFEREIFLPFGLWGRMRMDRMSSVNRILRWRGSWLRYNPA